jgi:hypothetical protein
MEPPESFDLWAWKETKEKIQGLPGRLGFPQSDTLRVLDLEVDLHSGEVRDITQGSTIEPPPKDLYWLLYRYAESIEVPLTKKLITFRQVSGGRAYASVFNGRVLVPFAKKFGEAPKKFQKAAKRLNGVSTPLGDLAYAIPAFPLVPLTFVLWLPDEEFPARAKFFMDSSVETYLDAEAITHLAAITTKRLLVIGES